MAHEKEIKPLDLGHNPGAVPGVGIGDVFKYLPVALTIIEGILAGGAEIPAFTTWTPGGKVRIGPIPIAKV